MSIFDVCNKNTNNRKLGFKANKNHNSCFQGSLRDAGVYLCLPLGVDLFSVSTCCLA